MKKILILNGGPRKNNNTAKLHSWHLPGKVLFLPEPASRLLTYII